MSWAEYLAWTMIVSGVMGFGIVCGGAVLDYIHDLFRE